MTGPATQELCGTCGCNCSDAADCRINVDLARDGVAREMFSNPLSAGYTAPSPEEVTLHYERTAGLRAQGEIDREAGS